MSTTLPLLPLSFEFFPPKTAEGMEKLSATRAALEHFEVDGEGLKVNPLAYWGRDELKAYMDAHDLPRHPLVAKGFRSIGCMPCTSKVAPGEDPRSGRWRGWDKTECGIHAAVQTPDHTVQLAPDFDPGL